MTHSYWTEFTIFATAHVFSLISPGPDFMMVVRNSLSYSRRTALYTALGIASGEMIHVTYSILGLGLIISQSSTAMRIAQYIGAAYLIYIGVNSLMAKKMKVNVIAGQQVAHDLTPIGAWWMGVMTNALNVKAAFFTLSFFAVLVSPDTPMSIQACYGLFIFASTFLWFMLVATFLTNDQVQGRIVGYKHWIERTAGAVLVIFGAHLALS